MTDISFQTQITWSEQSSYKLLTAAWNTFIIRAKLTNNSANNQPTNSSNTNATPVSTGSTRLSLPGAPYFSALLIALALIVLITIATHRQTEPQPVQVIVTRVAQPAQVTEGPSTVYVIGAVRKPGVYTLPSNSRIKDAIVRAGGMTGHADPMAINQAVRLRDEMQIVVPTREILVKRSPPARAIPRRFTPVPPISVPPKPTRRAIRSIHEPSTEVSTRPVQVIDLNTATAEQLESLPNIGPSKAQAILEYRQKHGNFERAIDIQKVSGIGPKTWERIRHLVKV